MVQTATTPSWTQIKAQTALLAAAASGSAGAAPTTAAWYLLSKAQAFATPELVYSRQTRREFSIVVDELSEQIASLNCDLDDDDATPPGPSRASESDHESSYMYRQYRDSGSYVSQAPSKHQHAFSDGAAQLLSSISTTQNQPPKTRARAATGTRASQPRLSLFPSPPKPTPSAI
jgi:hypothetical protein